MEDRPSEALDIWMVRNDRTSLILWDEVNIEFLKIAQKFHINFTAILHKVEGHSCTSFDNDALFGKIVNKALILCQM